MNRKLAFILAFFGLITVAFAATVSRYHIINSIIDSTTLGATTPSTVNATSLNASTLTLNGAAPSGHTLCGDGSHYIDSSSNCGTAAVATITKPSFSYGTIYQNTGTTSRLVTVTATDQSACTIQAKVGSTSPPSIIYGNQTVFSGGAYDAYDSLTFIVPSGWFYQVTKITGTTCAFYDATEAQL